MKFRDSNRMTQKSVFIIFIFLLHFFVFECVAYSESTKKIVYRGFYSRIVTNFNNIDNEINYNRFGRLVSYRGLANIIPDIAYKWEIQKQGKLFVFHLRKKIYFHDGSLLKASHIKKSLEFKLKNGSFLFLDNDVIVGQKAYFEKKTNHIKGIRSLDDNTISIELKRSYPFFLRALATLNFPIFKYKKGKITGTGPYVLKEQESSNSVIRKVRFSKFEKYYISLDEQPDQIIVFDLDKNYENFRPDILSISSINVDEINKMGNSFRKYKTFETFVHAIFFNIKSQWGGNINFRNFIGFGFDFRRAVKKVYRIHSAAVHNIIPLNLSSARKVPAFPQYNYSRSLYYLKKIRDKNKEVRMVIFLLPGRKKIGDKLKFFLIKHGFKVKEKIFDIMKPGNVRKVLFDADIIVAGYNDREDIFNSEFFLYRSLNLRGEDNVFNYRNQYIDEITRKLVMGEIRNRVAAMKFIVNLLIEDMIIIPLNYSSTYFFVGNGVKLKVPPQMPFLDYRIIRVNEK